MTHDKLTVPQRAATARALAGEGAAMERQGSSRRRAWTAGATFMAAGLAGCINIAAPDKPIVIELNVNIRQEVIYRLAEDAARTVEQNADIF